MMHLTPALAQREQLGGPLKIKNLSTVFCGEEAKRLVRAAYRAVLRASRGIGVRSLAMIETQVGRQPMLASLALQCFSNTSSHHSGVERIEYRNETKKEEVSGGVPVVMGGDD